ncbi:hypothetical protein RHM62_02895 [Actimicrobium sp. CCC2.4]|uniref:hypothetical protein n=1 Tax=Actimicrobium sp. CCC2.4 TaxID=3048606 RepID=UPI002AC9E35A|nr:hypothetical protein [Actimicrobium sp. CCC2.4]WPX32816.1 hypothetical protein RHM62_02895 [Actimicrobium sp. CCC2.4]
MRPTLVLAQRRRSTRQVTGDESSDVLPGALGKNAIPQECQGTAGIFFDDDGRLATAPSALASCL